MELDGAPGLEAVLAKRFRESQAGGRPVRFEHIVARGGVPRTLSITVAPIAAATHGRPRFSFVAENVTGRRRAETALRQSELAAATLEERSRLARDLHDSITQALFAVSLKAEALMQADASDLPPAVARVVQEVRRLSVGALAQMRTMLLELRGDPLEEVPIPQLLRNAVEATASRTSTTIALSIEGDAGLPAGLHVAVYRITQEALNNIARHAKAKQAWVELSISASRVRLSVRDDGRGFEPGALGPTHLGLQSMRERAAEAGARFHLASSAGGGTLVTVEWRAADDGGSGTRTEAERAKMEMERVEKALEARRRRVPPAPRPSSSVVRRDCGSPAA